MSNVIHFKKRVTPEAAVVEEVVRIEPAGPVVRADILPLQSSEESAFILMMRALSFYASQGYDGGAKARKAIATYQRETQSEPGPA